MNSKIKKNIKKNLLLMIKSFSNLNFINNDIYDACLKCIQCIKNNNKIIFCGNGGSAADSQHLSAELIGKFLKKRSPLPAVSITTNTSVITSIGNDISFNEIFSRQLESIGSSGDILFAISTSGKSKNILNAIKLAKKKKIFTILLTGKKSKLKNNKNILIIKAPATRVDRIQEMHIGIGHLICEEIENFFAIK